MFCPYYKNKEVFDGFNEIIESLGGRPMTEEEFRDSELRNQRTGLDFQAMEAAYIVYDKNGGNLLDKTPWGTQSILFQTLLDYFKGDRKKAIVAKSNVYSDEFFNWFGDWTAEEKENVSKVVDQNGEPLVVYAVFEPNQIKHIENLGTWDPKTDNIYKSKLDVANLEDVNFIDSMTYSDLGTDIFSRLSSNLYVGSDEIISQMQISGCFAPYHRILSEVLQRHSIPVVIDSSLDNDTAAEAHLTKNNRVFIAINPICFQQILSKEDFGRIFLHEVIHAVTIKAIHFGSTSLETKFAKANNRMWKITKKAFDKYVGTHYADLGFYALENEDEFAAEFVTNNDARDVVYGLLERLDKDNQNTFIQAFKNFINSLVHLFVNKDVFKTNIEKFQQYQKRFVDYLAETETIEKGNVTLEQAKAFYWNFNKKFLVNRALRENINSISQWEKTVSRAYKMSTVSLNKSEKDHVYDFDDVAQKLEVRVKAIRTSSLSKSEKTKLINSTKSQIEMFRNQQVSKYVAITSTLRQVVPQLLDDVRQLKNININELETLSSEDYMYQLHSNIGTYKNIAEILVGLLEQNTTKEQLLTEYNKDLPKDQKLTDEDLLELHNSVNDLLNITTDGDRILQILGERAAKRILRNKAQSEQAGEQMEKYLDEITQNPAFDDDIGVLASNFGAVDSDSNEALRALSSIVNRALQKADDATLDRTLELLKLENALKVGESVVDLYETDDSRLTTGYLIRKLNYGKFYKAYDNELVRINRLFNSELKDLQDYRIVEETHRIAPDVDTIIPENIVQRLGLQTKDNNGDDIKWSVRQAWNELRSRWLYENCERKYTKAYYDAWNKVPQVAKDALDAINSEISAILSQDGVFDEDGHYHYDRLSDKDWKLLEDLWIQKKVLRSDYDLFGNKKEEGSIPWKIAKALQQLNADLYQGEERKLQKDTKAWKQSLNKEIEACGGIDKFNAWKRGEKKHGFNVSRYKKWHLRNSRLEFKKDDEGNAIIFKDIEDAMQGYDIDYGPEYEELSNQANKILKPYRAQNGEIIVYEIPESVKNTLLDIYSKQREIRQQIYEDNPALGELANKKREVYESFVVNVDTEYFKVVKRELAKTATEEDGTFNQDLYDALLDSYGYTLIDSLSGMDEGFMPYRWTQRMEAIDKDKYMEYVPGDAWIEKVDDEKFVNDKYTQLSKEEGNENTAFIPKAFDKNGKVLYDNSKAFSKFDKNSNKYSQTLRDMYDATLRTMRESNEMQTNRQYTDDYLLPQITGSIFKRMKRHPWFNRHLALVRWLRYKFGDKPFKVTRPDKIAIAFRVIKELFGLSTNSDDLSQAGLTEAADSTDSEGNTTVNNAIHGQYADGRTFHILPQYYTRRMQDTSQISSDLVNILSNYYKMSSYYKEKLAIKDDCETIVDFLRNRGIKRKKYIFFGEETDSRVYTTAQKFLEMNLYDMRRTNKKLKFGKLEWNYSKAVSTWKAWTTARNLGLNPKVALTGFMTSMGMHIINSLVGQNYSIKDSGVAFSESIRRLFQSCIGLRYLGSPSLSNDDLIVMAEQFGVSNQAERKWEGSNRNPILQAAYRHSVFGFMSMADFWSKTQIMTAVVRNHRYINGQFLSKDDMRSSRHLYASKKEFNRALAEWNKGPSLYHLLHSKNGKLTITDKYKDAWLACKDIVKDRVQKTAEYADGMATPLQKAAITQSIIGSLILIHRQYLPLILQRHWGKRVYDYDTHMYKNGVFRTLFNFVAEMMKNNLMLGIGCGAFTGFIFGGPIGSVIGSGIGMAMRTYGLSQGSNKSAKQIFKERFSDFSDRESSMQSYANRYAMKEVLWVNLIMYTLVQPLVAMACSVADDDKDDRWWMQMLLYSLRAFEWEFYTAYRTDDVLNNFKSPSASQAVLDKLEEVAFTMQPQTNILFDPSQSWENITSIFNKDSKKIKKGAYKGWTPFERALFNLTPYHNVWEQYKDSKSKRKYLENQIMRIKKPEE